MSDQIEVVFCYEDNGIVQGIWQKIDQGTEIQAIVTFAIQMDLDPAKVTLKYVYRSARLNMTVDESEDEEDTDESDLSDEDDPHRAISVLVKQHNEADKNASLEPQFQDLS